MSYFSGFLAGILTLSTLIGIIGFVALLLQRGKFLSKNRLVPPPDPLTKYGNGDEH